MEGNITAPKTVMAMPVIKATNIDGAFDERRLVVKSRTVTHATAPRADIEYTEKPSKPGRTIIITPIKPIKIANQRLQLTDSLKKMAAPIVTARGKTCRIAVTLASGIWANADKKKIAAPTSEAVLMTISFQSDLESLTNSCFAFQAKNSINGMVSIPLRKMAW